MSMKKLFYILIYFLSTSEAKDLHVPFCSAWHQNHTLTIGSPFGLRGNSTSTLNQPSALTIDRRSDTVYVVDSGNNRIMKFANNSNIGEEVSFRDSSLDGRLSRPADLVLASSGAMYISDTGNHRVVGWTFKPEKSRVVVEIESPQGLHLDEEKEYLYIVRGSYPAVIRYHLSSKRKDKVAGDYNRGATARTLANLYNPIGIYVDRNDNIYVAEYSGPYITRWREKQQSGRVVAGRFGSATTTLALLYSPASILVDDQDTMYIADVTRNQVLRWEKNVTVGTQIPPHGTIRVGNRTERVFATVQPYDIAFDGRFNLYTLESSKHRIKRFNIYFIKSCMLIFCRPPTIHLEPHSPVYTRSESITISITAELDCYIWETTDMRCRVSACYPGDKACSRSEQLDHLVTSFVQRDSHSLVIPPFGLPVGSYDFNCTIRMTETGRSSWVATSLRIIRSPVLITLLPIGQSEMVVDQRQSFKLQANVTVKSDDQSYLRGLKFVYYCRKYLPGGYSKLNIGGNNRNLTQSNCFNLTAKPRSFVYDDPLSRSSLTILSQSLQTSQTYEFYVEMYNNKGLVDRSDAILVKVVSNDVLHLRIASPFDFFTLDHDHSLFNPSTQLILDSSSESPLANASISWRIYAGTKNLRWTPYISPNISRDKWFYGINTHLFTVTSEFFLSNCSIDYWRFEVTYSTRTQTGSAAVQLKTNHIPLKKNCSVDLLDGTTKTLFTFSCFDWADLDEIRDYFLHVLSMRNEIRMSIAHSDQSTFSAYLPAGDPKLNYRLRLIIHVRDQLGARTPSNIIEIRVIPDREFVDAILKFSMNKTDEMASDENQVIQSFAVILNQMSLEDEENFMKKSSVQISEYLISTFESERANNSIANQRNNATILFLQNQNRRSTIREHFLTIFHEFPQPSTIEQIILLSSTINQLTNTISEWTQTSFTLAATICEQYANITYSISREMTFEQIVLVANALAPCPSNIFTGVNAPLQQRGFIFDSNFEEDDMAVEEDEEVFDYEYLEIPLCNLTNLRKSKKCKEIARDKLNRTYEVYHRNRFYYLQKLRATELTARIDAIISLLAKSLRRHLNLFQTLSISYPSLRMLVEQISPNGLEDKLIDLYTRNASIHIPHNLSNFTSGQLGIRTTLLPLAPADGTVNVSLSTALTLSVLDNDDAELQVNTSNHSLIEMFIPRDINLYHPEFTRQNLTQSRVPKRGKLKVNRQFFIYYFDITPDHPDITTSIHFELMPMFANISFEIIYKLAHVPAWNLTHRSIDGAAMFCSRNLSEEMNYYRFYLDNEQTAAKTSLYLGIREVEEREACGNLLPRVTNQPYGFSQDVFIRTYTSGCFFLDEKEQWQSLGMKVGPKTNIDYTHCFSNHT